MSLDPDWRNDEKSDYNIERLFDTQLFKSRTDETVMNWRMLKLVGLYICKHGSTKLKMYFIANLIANESSATKKIEPHKFVDAIKPILRMAVIEFSRAVFETEFT